MKYHILFSVLITALFLPFTSYGALLDSSATPITKVETTSHATSSTVGLFTISFTLTAFGNDIIVPSQSERNYHATTSDNESGILFNIYNQKGTRIMDGNLLGFLYASGRKAEGGYKIKKNMSRKFTAVGVYDNKGVASDRYHLRIDGIRYFVHDNKGVAVLETNGLRSYISKGIPLSK